MPEMSGSGARGRDLFWICVSPLLAVLISVAFNVAYGLTYIEPLLTVAQNQALQQAILRFNVLAFPLVALCWVWLVASLRPALVADANARLESESRQRLRARAINLPWYFAAMVAISNLLCLPVFLSAVRAVGEPLHATFALHLAVAVFIAAMITITIAFFLIELLVQAWLLPVLFRQLPATGVPGALTLTLGLRGLLMSLAAGAGPITMLLLLGWVEDEQRGTINHFRLAVGALGVMFGLVSAWLLGRMVLPPVMALRQASRAVSAGRLDAEVRLVRADEFGTLIHEFNRMLHELREKQRLRETFGLHVGQAAAEQILANDPGLGGQLRTVTALFCDIRGFTASSASRPPAEVVARLNEFLGAMVDIVESRHGGMINKFLGDGFMALFGATHDVPGHAESAVNAAREMLQAATTYHIGIGIHTGEAIVGNIGSPSRLEYTAIGSTINIAARLESLTKDLAEPVLLSDATRRLLSGDIPLRALGAHAVRGMAAPMELHALVTS